MHTTGVLWVSLNFQKALKVLEQELLHNAEVSRDLFFLKAWKPSDMKLAIMMKVALLQIVMESTLSFARALYLHTFRMELSTA